MLAAEFYSQAFPPQEVYPDNKFFMREIKYSQDVEPQHQKLYEHDIPQSWDNPAKETSGAVTAS